MDAASFVVPGQPAAAGSGTVRLFENGDPDFNLSHTHSQVELICVLSGQTRVIIGGRVEQATEGDVFLVGSEVQHAVLPPSGSCGIVVVHFDVPFLAELAVLLNNFQPAGASGKKSQRQKINRFPFLNSTGVLWRDQSCGVLPEILKLRYLSGIDTVIASVRVLSALGHCPQSLIFGPMHPGQPLMKERVEDKIRKVFEYTEQHYRETITLPHIAAVVNFTVTSFCRYFKKWTGKNYYHYLNEVRIRKACLLLMEDYDRNIEEVCYTIGYSSPSTFYKHFRKLLNISPREFQHKTRKEQKAGPQKLSVAD